MQGLCDSGATRSVISDDLAKRLQLKVTKSQLKNPLVPASGQPIFLIGQVSINVNIHGLIVPSMLTTYTQNKSLETTGYKAAEQS